MYFLLIACPVALLVVFGMYARRRKDAINHQYKRALKQALEERSGDKVPFTLANEA
jgi:hypothetical protein